MINNIYEIKLMEEVFSKGVVDLNNPTCSSCDNCCGIFSLITKEEYEQLEKYLKTKEGRQRKHSAKKRVKKYAEQNIKYLKCPFLVKKRCSIYNIRPSICKEFHCSPELDKSDIKKYKDGLSIYHLFKDLY